MVAARSTNLSVGRWTIVLLSAAIVTELAAKFTFGELFRDGASRSGKSLSRGGAFRAALVGTGVARLIPVGGAVTPLAMAWSVGDESEGTIGAAIRATVLSYGGLAFASGAGLISYWLPAIGGVAAGGHSYLRRRRK